MNITCKQVRLQPQVSFHHPSQIRDVADVDLAVDPRRWMETIMRFYLMCLFFCSEGQNFENLGKAPFWTFSLTKVNSNFCSKCVHLSQSVWTSYGRRSGLWFKFSCLPSQSALLFLVGASPPTSSALLSHIPRLSCASTASQSTSVKLCASQWSNTVGF